MSESLTPLQAIEREALTGNRFAIVELSSAIREYRSACEQLLSKVYHDGYADSVAISELREAIQRIEQREP